MSILLTGLLNRCKVYSQYFIPKHLLTKLISHISHCQIPWIKNMLIKQYIKLFKIDMTLAKEQNVKHYLHLNQFFTRELSTYARPIIQDQQKILSPIDGSVSQIGRIQNGNIIQAKGKSYSLQQLIIQKTLVNTFYDGTFATLYLSPKDYHRIHMPISAQLRRMIYVPGTLFSVNPATVQLVDSVFTKNERVINIFHSHRNTMAIIMIGAIVVGSMETVWSGTVTPAQNRSINDICYKEQKIMLQQGQEMGRFNMGSTVILLFPKNIMLWSSTMCVGKNVIVGEPIGQLTTHAQTP